MKKAEKPELPVLAVDLGGTKINIAIISGHGGIMAQERYPTLADEGPEAVINRLFAAIDNLLASKKIKPSQLDGISLAAAGAIDMAKGIITLSPNLPGWRDISLKDMVRRRYPVEVFLVNDAKAAALGEHRFGAGRGVKDLILLTVGTGIGGGIIINGELYTGYCGSAGEIGHMTIDVNGPKCNCGNTGCLETLASGTAIARDAIRRISHGEKSALATMVGRTGEITAEMVGTAAIDGDLLAREAVLKAASYLGVGLVNLVNIFNPEMIIVGGGVANLGELLLGPARQAVQERAFPISAQAVRIVPAELGNEAGIYGAAAFALSLKARR
ncbi:MAG: ROK family protein [Chloroflexi bacterium]|nr:ROK family protein [Chloroflexota bacterium]